MGRSTMTKSIDLSRSEVSESDGSMRSAMLTGSALTEYGNHLFSQRQRHWAIREVFGVDPILFLKRVFFDDDQLVFRYPDTYGRMGS